MKNWIYYGIFFSDTTKAAILNYTKKTLSNIGYNIPDDWKVYCDHVTLLFNDKSEEKQKEAEGLNLFLGDQASMRVISIGISGRAIALEVDYITQNKHSHVTVAIAPEAKPVESNDITSWIPVEDSFYITGTYKVVGRN